MELSLEEWIRLLRDVAAGVAALGGLLIAALGLHTWRKQLKGHTEYELGRRLLRATYGLREEVSRVRSPFMSGGEIEHAVREAGYEMEKPTDPMGYTHAVYARIRRLQDRLQEFALEALEAEVVWGAEVHEVATSMRKICVELMAAAQWHADEHSYGRSFRGDGYLENLRKAFSTASKPEDDDFGQRFSSEVAKVEAFVRPRLMLK